MRIIILYFLFSKINCFIPSNNKNKKFKMSKSPEEDLKIIVPKQAISISDNWLNNIILYIVNRSKEKLDKNLHEVNNINDYEESFFVHNLIYFKGNITDTNIYMSWMPRGLYGTKEVLYLIEIEKNDSNLNVKRLIQSPFWNSQQINSKKLKKSLIIYGIKNKMNINFDILYLNDIRHKLSWKDNL
jgi:protein involved in sex pheromone biosynthesis